MLSRCGEDAEYTMVDSLRVGYTITVDALDTPYKKISKMEDWDRRRSKRFPTGPIFRAGWAVKILARKNRANFGPTRFWHGSLLARPDPPNCHL